MPYNHGKIFAAITLAAILVAGAPGAAALHYRCEDLAKMAARFHELKQKGYTLEDVLAIVQKASNENSEKAELLSSLAIDIYSDDALESGTQARHFTLKHCAENKNAGLSGAGLD